MSERQESNESDCTNPQAASTRLLRFSALVRMLWRGGQARVLRT